MLFTKDSINPKEYSPLALAYIGDSVYDLFIRTKVLSKGNRHVTVMHRDSVHYVKAHSQAQSAHNIEAELTEDELKSAEKSVQDLTDKYIKNVDAVTSKKEKEIMQL